VHTVESAKKPHAPVKKGEADAAFSFRTCPLPEDPSKSAAAKGSIVQELPGDSYDQASIIVGVLRNAPRAQAAAEFVRFFDEPATRQLFAANHFPDERTGN